MDFKARFLFITRGDPKLILEKARKMTIDVDKIKISAATREDVPLHLSIVDLGIFFIKPAYSKRASSATKLGEMLAMGLPVITNKIKGDADHLLKNYKCGVLLDSFEYTPEILAAIHTVENQASKSLAKDIYDLSKSISKYHKIYFELALATT